MKQIVYPAALGSCALGAGIAPVRAAEWSIAPVYGSSVDYDSNRRLLIEGKGSEAATVSADLKFKWALENLTLTLEPRYALRRFTDAALGNGDDRSVNAELNWVRERSSLDLTASYWNQSTLTSELLETGIVSADTHRRATQAGMSWNWSQTERRALIAQMNYLDVSYYGLAAAQLPGYRYPSGSLGERFFFTERGSFTVSAFGSSLESSTQGNSSREAGLQAQIIYQFSEKTNLDASLGESRRNLAHQSSFGTNASVLLTHSLFLGNLAFSYTRSLVPYGFGFLVEQQQYSAALTRPLTPYLDSTVSILRIQNNETALLLNLDRRNYNSLSASLRWHPAETWSLGARLEAIRTQTPGVAGEEVKGFRSYFSVTWTPFPASRSW
jgi:hypothetical protein